MNQEEEEREEDEFSLFYIVKDGKTALMVSRLASKAIAIM